MRAEAKRIDIKSLLLGTLVGAAIMLSGAAEQAFQILMFPAETRFHLDRFCPGALARIGRMRLQIQTQEPVPPPGCKCNALPFSLTHALRVKAAHYWLALGESDQALRELEALPSHAWQHPLAVAVRLAALRTGGCV
jgi:hypothetical protein